MNFRKLVTVDNCGLTGPYRQKILALSTASADEHASDPVDDEEMISRIGDADCVLVSWRTRIGANILSACPSIRYIGMCCSLYDEKSANVDIAAARERGIVVKGVRDYGDEGTVEFIFAQLISLYKGMGLRQWGAEPTELGGKRLGIIGMGTVGKMVARTALAFGMKVAYHSRTRKPEMENLGVEFMEPAALLPACDVVSLHLPRNTLALAAGEFDLMKDGAILVNTSLGKPFDMAAFSAWIRRGRNNLGVFDMAGAEAVVEAKETHPNVFIYPRSSGFTAEAKERLTRKAFDNMTAFLADI